VSLNILRVSLEGESKLFEVSLKVSLSFSR
jgi:hypothetical protein